MRTGRSPEFGKPDAEPNIGRMIRALAYLSAYAEVEALTELVEEQGGQGGEGAASV